MAATGGCGALGQIFCSSSVLVAEEIGLIVPLGEWVLRKACANAARWPDDVKVAVNLSPIQVKNQNLVAEGVETRQQLHQVQALGCTEMQGFLFSPPRCVDEIIPLFKRFEAKAMAAEARRRA